VPLCWWGHLSNIHRLSIFIILFFIQHFFNFQMKFFGWEKCFLPELSSSFPSKACIGCQSQNWNDRNFFFTPYLKNSLHRHTTLYRTLYMYLPFWPRHYF
jgi:hypothetical protein